MGTRKKDGGEGDVTIQVTCDHQSNMRRIKKKKRTKEDT